MDENQTSQMCVSIPLLSDNIVEESESFFILLTTTDPSVIITRGNASFVILDDTSEQISTIRINIVSWSQLSSL